MKKTISTLSKVGTGQRVRLTFKDSSSIEIRVNQKEYTPDERLRLELTGDDSGNDGRYRLETHVEDGDWVPLTVQRYTQVDDLWKTFDEVSDVVLLETFQTMTSSDMKAQENTGGTGETESDDQQSLQALEVKLNDLPSVLNELEFPCQRATVVEEQGNVTLLLADGTENLGDLVADSDEDLFESMDDLLNEVMNLLPRHAVGEPYQSEGEG